MQAIAIVPGGTTDLKVVERPEPTIERPADVKLKVLKVGICGTDREEAAGGRAEAPAGSKEIIIGHEMLGRVIEVGPAVKGFATGDLGVFMVRRPCSGCPSCDARQPDMCLTGNYTERGIKGRDGFQAEFVVDGERFLVKIPPSIAHLGVLTEPTSVGSKALDDRNDKLVRRCVREMLWPCSIILKRAQKVLGRFQNRFLGFWLFPKRFWGDLALRR